MIALQAGLGNLSAVTVIRLAIAGLALVLVLAWTGRRVLANDYDDPSISIGRDYFLVRASGIVAVAVVIIVAAIALWPEIQGTSRGLAITVVLGSLLAFWTFSEWRESA